MATEDAVAQFRSGRMANPEVSSQEELAQAGRVARETDPYVEAVDNPIQAFKAGVASGVSNVQAQNQNFMAAIATLKGDENAMQNRLEEAGRLSNEAAIPLAGMEQFDEFLEEPTISGFFNQMASATGQFVPSAVATVAEAALAGAAVAGITIATGGTATPGLIGAAAIGRTTLKNVPRRIAERGGSREYAENLIEKSYKNALATKNKTALPYPKMRMQEELDLDAIYLALRGQKLNKRFAQGGIAGALGQEFRQGSGIAYGDYAEQGMTTKGDAVASFLQGGVFAGIGVGSEAAVAGSFLRTLKKGRVKRQAVGDDPFLLRNANKTSVLKDLGYITGVTAFSEGLAELLQEELSVQQKFRIDDTYTTANANLDRKHAAFAGFFGGAGLGGAIGSGPAVFNKSRELLNRSLDEEHLRQVYNERQGEVGEGHVFQEHSDLIEENFDMMFNESGRDSVWVDIDSRKQWQKVQDKISNKYNGEYFSVTSLGKGVFFTRSEKKAQAFSNMVDADPYNTEMQDDWLAQNIGYSRSRRIGDDQIVGIRNKKTGKLAWYQQTTTEKEDNGKTGTENAVSAANRVMGRSRDKYDIVYQTPSEHFAERMEGLEQETTGFNEDTKDPDTVRYQEFDSEGSEQVAADSKLAADAEQDSLNSQLDLRRGNIGEGTEKEINDYIKTEFGIDVEYKDLVHFAETSEKVRIQANKLAQTEAKTKQGSLGTKLEEAGVETPAVDNTTKGKDSTKKALGQLKPSTKARYLKTLAAIREARSDSSVKSAGVQADLDALGTNPMVAVSNIVDLVEEALTSNSLRNSTVADLERTSTALGTSKDELMPSREILSNPNIAGKETSDNIPVGVDNDEIMNRGGSGTVENPFVDLIDGEPTPFSINNKGDKKASPQQIALVSSLIHPNFKNDFNRIKGLISERLATRFLEKQSTDNASEFIRIVPVSKLGELRASLEIVQDQIPANITEFQKTKKEGLVLVRHFVDNSQVTTKMNPNELQPEAFAENVAVRIAQAKKRGKNNNKNNNHKFRVKDAYANANPKMSNQEPGVVDIGVLIQGFVTLMRRSGQRPEFANMSVAQTRTIAFNDILDYFEQNNITLEYHPDGVKNKEGRPPVTLVGPTFKNTTRAQESFTTTPEKTTEEGFPIKSKTSNLINEIVNDIDSGIYNVGGDPKSYTQIAESFRTNEPKLQRIEQAVQDATVSIGELVFVKDKSGYAVFYDLPVVEFAFEGEGKRSKNSDIGPVEGEMKTQQTKRQSKEQRTKTNQAKTRLKENLEAREKYLLARKNTEENPYIDTPIGELTYDQVETRIEELTDTNYIAYSPPSGTGRDSLIIKNGGNVALAFMEQYKNDTNAGAFQNENGVWTGELVQNYNNEYTVPEGFLNFWNKTLKKDKGTLNAAINAEIAAVVSELLPLTYIQEEGSKLANKMQLPIEQSVVGTATVQEWIGDAIILKDANEFGGSAQSNLDASGMYNTSLENLVINKGGDIDVLLMENEFESISEQEALATRGRDKLKDMSKPSPKETLEARLKRSGVDEQETSANSKYAKKTEVSENVQAIDPVVSEDLEEGLEINHKDYGTGTVLAISRSPDGFITKGSGLISANFSIKVKFNDPNTGTISLVIPKTGTTRMAIVQEGAPTQDERFEEEMGMAQPDEEGATQGVERENYVAEPTEDGEQSPERENFVTEPEADTTQPQPVKNRELTEDEQMEEQYQEANREQAEGKRRAKISTEARKRADAKQAAKQAAKQETKPKPALKPTEFKKGLNAKTRDKIIQAARRLGLRTNIKIFNANEKINLGSGGANVRIKKAQDQMKADIAAGRKVLGANVSFRNYDVILLAPRADGNVGGYAQTLMHELGESFVRQETDKSLKVSKVREKLLAEFAKEKAKPNTPSAYKNQDTGFDEWVADQFGAAIREKLGISLDADKSFKEMSVGAKSWFRRLAKKLLDFYNSLGPVNRRRLEANETAQEYIATVADKYRAPTQKKIPYEVKARIEKKIESILGPETFSDKQLRKVQDKAIKLLSLDKMPNWVKRLLYTSDGRLRDMGPAGVLIADFYYNQSRSLSKTGLLLSRNRLTQKYVTKVAEILNVNDNFDLADPNFYSTLTPSQNAILAEAESDTPTAELTNPKAKELREFLGVFYDELGLKDLGVAKRADFFPRFIAIYDVAGDENIRKALIGLLAEKNPEVALGQVTKAVDSLVEKGSGSLEFESKTNDPLDVGIMKSYKPLFDKLTREDLRSINAIEAPEVALKKYIDKAVTRSEFEKRGGVKYLRELMEQLTPAQQEEAQRIQDGMMGRIKPITNGILKMANNVGLVLNIVTLLAFTVLASIPDLAGPVLRSRSLDTRPIFNVLKDMIKNPEEGRQLAKEIGVIGIDAMSTFFINAGEVDFLSQGGQKVSNTFFRVTGLEMFTRFTRVFATGMGKQFLLDHAKKAKAGEQTSVSYLQELQVTAAEVDAWAEGKASPEVKAKVDEALARFVDESIVRPNSAERPNWANDPRYALIWQLKSFYYAYGKTIVGGALRDAKGGAKNGGISAAAMPLAMMALMLLPLTMLGWEIREWTKAGLSWILPGVSPSDPGVDYFKTDSMTNGQYLIEAVDRAGILGPGAMALPLFLESHRHGKPFWIGALGPAAERGYDGITLNWKPSDFVPVYSQLDTRAFGDGARE